MGEPYKFNDTKRQAFLEKLRHGLRRGAAAEAVGLTRWQVCNYVKAHPEFAREIDQAELDACDIVEDALWRKACEGNVTAILVWLYNRAPDRWKDKRQPVVNNTTVEMGEEQLKELLRQRGFKE